MLPVSYIRREYRVTTTEQEEDPTAVRTYNSSITVPNIVTKSQCVLKQNSIFYKQSTLSNSSLVETQAE